MTLSVGSRLGPYEIMEAIGSGGMGEVYRARDTRLNRTVALKVLPAHLSGNPELNERFEREARAVSSLNHPNICTLHDVGRQDGIGFLVMEYLEGESLAKRLERGRLPLDQALRCAIEIASALAAAHRGGLIHRDLKPGNIILTKSGSKLLDFGIAKAIDSGAASAAATGARLGTLATSLSQLTAHGAVLGTMQYMSPEQLEGKDADERSDIFAFGTVLYEMVAGQPAFAGKSQASVIAKILEQDPPPLSQLQPMTPPALERLVRNCIEKNPDNRRQSVQDIVLDLKWIVDAGSQVAAPAKVAAAKPKRRLGAWLVTAALIVLLLGSLTGNLLYFRKSAQSADPMRLLIEVSEGVVLGGPDAPVVSPDGRHVAITGMAGMDRRLWVRSLDSLGLQLLPGTTEAVFPFWSPDSREIGFYAEGKLKKISLAGGMPQTLCDAPVSPDAALGGTWNGEGTIVFGRGAVLCRIPAAGGEPQPVTTLDPTRQESVHRFPFFLPDGRHFVYMARSMLGRNHGLCLGSVDGGSGKFLLSMDSSAQYSASGHLLVCRDQTLMAAPFDPAKLQFTGEAGPVVDGLARLSVLGASAFTFSSNGVLVYRQGNATATLHLAWYGRDGKMLGVVGEPRTYGQLALSPDGKRAVVEVYDPTERGYHLWLLELSTGVFSRLTYTGTAERDPVWSLDGTRVVYDSIRKGAYDLYEKVIGSEGETLLLETREDKIPEAWTPDGRSLLFMPRDGTTINALPSSGERKPRVVLRTSYRKDEPHISPDGRWVAYGTIESGRWEVYIASFPGFTDKRQVSIGGGGQPRWRKDGRELYYMDLEGRLFALEVNPVGAGLETSVPKVLFKANVIASALNDQYEATQDGKRFLVVESVQESAPPLQLILNWTALRRR